MHFRSFLMAAASVAAVAGAAQAQDVAPADDTTAVDQVVVTGTRVARSRLDTVSPVDVVDNKALTRQGTPELAQALANLAPSLDFPRPAVTDGTDSVRPATLRGLSPDQTLVLLNGHRAHTAALVNINGSIGRGSAPFDLNTIPTAALDRVEILREGAAAQYGSDAIAGVINLRLREASHGGGASATYGIYDTEVKTTRNRDGRTAHDGPTYSASLWQGFALPNDGFLTLTGEYSFRNPTNRADLDLRVSPRKVTGVYGDPQVETKTIYANFGLPLNDAWSLYGLAGYQNRKGESSAFPRLADNANNYVSVYPTGYVPRITTKIDDYNLAFGTKGVIGGFNVDASVTHGENKVEYGTINSLNASLGPSSPTRFKDGSMQYGQTVAAIDVNRPLELFGFAKPSTLAFGIEYRDESYKIEAGETASWVNGGNGKGAGAQGFPGFRPANEVDVSRNATSLYVDLDNQITDKLDIDLAARYEDYSDFGSTTTGKIAARYDFTDNFALRGAFSSGFRAPALQQQYFTTTSINIIAGGAAVDVGTFPATSATAAALGAKPLEPEKSKNYSLGAVYHKGPFELTVDAYQIDIDNRIVLSENIQGVNGGTPTQQAIYNLLQPFGVTTARFFVNGVDTTSKGVDVVARYRLDADAAGRFDLTLAANYNQTDVNKVPTTSTLSGLPVPPPLFARVNILTYEQGTPDHKLVAAGDWSNGPWGATLRGTAYGSVLIPNATPSLDYKSGAKTVWDAEARYTFLKDVTWALGVNNLFDEYPDRAPAPVNTTGVVAFPSYSPFGFNGRFLYTRLSYSW
ncbi:TonB-dependent receptor [Caulobacter sp. Root1455]|uniref:TonB-dependent receptor plug domain-containing protein n=1 Tax=unclassified Caulobacter TaxID=2648921 RepID=UPI0006F316F1|nr:MULTISPECIES: TonB-dependent receptor [unclassified Caulobacter]KQY29765.1 TonB-dependent receptor [Caulobacter sp. Root487D2Y]KQZ05945.1 TonB-dependent receptor [Caulobacter sp. Root1455]